VTPFDTGALGGLDSPGVSPYPMDMDIITDRAQLPKDPSKLPDDAVINLAVWAHLQGVELATVYRNKTKSDARRGTDAARPGDMPAEDGRFGHGPYYFMRTYRAWEAARPGKGAGAGRPVGSGKGRAVKVALPVTCPHCKHEITRDDLGLDESGRPAVSAGPVRQTRARSSRPAVGRSGKRALPAAAGKS
jgi:hypothetical protein